MRCNNCNKIIKEKEISQCPTCGYIYCPECTKKMENKQEDKCNYCDAVLNFVELPFRDKNDQQL